MIIKMIFQYLTLIGFLLIVYMLMKIQLKFECISKIKKDRGYEW